MPLDPDALLRLDIPAVTASHGWRDAALYALGVGAGMDPIDRRDLRLVDGPALRTLPTFATVLGYEGFWVEQLPTGIDVSRVLHGEQSLVLHAPIPSEGRIRRTIRPIAVTDKGEGRGALIHVEEAVCAWPGGDPLATLRSTIVCRGDGGCGSAGVAPPPLALGIPDRPADGRVAIAGSPQQALIYRLSGDLNPLHADPAAAAAAGFARPVLHGLALFGTACRVLLHELCGGETGSLRALHARFRAPVLPGDPLDLRFWREDGGTVAFRIGSAEPVLDGRLELTPDTETQCR